MARYERDQALINGALIAIGTAAVLNNIIAHWLLGLHRAIPGPWTGSVEVRLIFVGAASA
ncbi:MAG: hypothetical protein ACRDIB_18195 [Ardenticatenaceae bacterium]